MPVLVHQLVQATGFEDPLRWVDQSGETILQAPEFYFEFEVKRLASELKTELKSEIPQWKEAREELRDYEGQTTDADSKDFEDALAKGEIKPPDVEKARAAHNEVRRLLSATEPPRPPEHNREEETEPTATPAAPAEPAAPPKPTEDSEKKLAQEMPSEFADYHRGALAYRINNLDDARTAWKALLARPAAERRYRTTWATFMLGKTAIQQSNWDEAAEWFAKTRQAVRDGFVDTMGLGSSSLGWEGRAHLEAKRFPEAARVYLEQLATGDYSAVYSLRDVMTGVFVDDADLSKVVADPVLQRIATACAVAGLGPFADSGFGEKEDNSRAAQWLRALEAAGVKNVRDADRVAWIAYTHGDYTRAARWLQRADETSPYTLWLKAKLALRDGKVDTATQLLSRAIRTLPKDEELQTRTFVETEQAPIYVAKGDLGLLQFTRGDYLTAFQLFMDGVHEDDVAYMAEGILTLKELSDIVEKQSKEEKRETNEWDRRAYIPEQLRRTLARRLIRAGRYAEARPYFSEEQQKTLDEYVSLLQRTKAEGLSKEERAKAFARAAEFVNETAYELFEIYEVEPQAARLSGREVTKDSYPAMTLTYGEKLKLPLSVTKAERARLKQNAQQPLRHSHGLYVAADLAWKAAALMPDNDEQTAKFLNEVGSWLKYRDDGAADRFYQAIERRCAKTELGKQAIKRHWFVPIEEETPQTKDEQ